MFKKVKRRIIAMEMIIIAIVLVISNLFISTLIYVNLTDNVQNSLSNYASDSYYTPHINIGEEDNDELFDIINDNTVCVFLYTNGGEIKQLNIGNAKINDNLLDDVIDKVLSDEENFGTISEYSLFYCKNKTLSGTRIALADSGEYSEFLISMLKYIGILCSIFLLAFFLISSVSASIIIAPLKKNWQQQKNFIADASHELKTPLTVILANCKILEAHKESTVEEQYKWVKSTDEEASHMKELVNKLLLLAKNESTKTEVIKSPVNISDMVTSLCLQFEPVAYEAGVKVFSNIEKGIIINSDPTAVKQIIHILIDNAVKYAGLGGEVTVSLRKKNNSVFLYTKNTGEPINKEEIQHIFERFYRSDKARTSGSGYGLGLPICRSLVNGIGANITVTSDEVNGTVFTVKFKIK